MKAEISRRPTASESYGIVADWTQALNERVDLANVLNRLMRLLNADAAMITRISAADRNTRYVARSDAETGKVWPTPSRSCAEMLLGDSLSTARAGSVWKLSELRSADCGALEPQREAGFDNLIEVIVCPLEITKGHTDALELHYRHQPAGHDLDLIAMLIETLSIGWCQRLPGLAAKKLKRKPKYLRAAFEENIHLPILGVENPAQLSRSEFRVCSLLKEGMTVNLIAENLSICTATVRSHLSSIFAKTGTANQVELLHELNRPGTAERQIVNG